MKDKKLVTRIGIVGIAGKMGRAIAKSAFSKKNILIKSGSENYKNKFIGKDIGHLIGEKDTGIKVTDSIDNFFNEIDVVIEFGLEKATLQYLSEAKKNKKAFISGSTALSNKTILLMKKTSKHIPVFWAPNMSLGANLLRLLAEQTTKKLGYDFDIDITDIHHKHKKDTPSGTAKFIKDSIDKSLKEIKVRNKKINISALRSGDSTGEHSVIFSGEGERLTIEHVSSSRKIFANGAVKVASWIHNRKPGLYTMSDFLKI